MAIISNGTTIADAGAFSASLGSMVLIKTITISSGTGTISFVDGASRVQILRHIIAPLSTPGLVVVGIYAFIGAYAQQFLFAITFNQKKEYMPIPSGLYEFIGYQSVKWNEMMAASLVGIAPVLILFIFLQKYIVEGLTAGAVKN